MEYCDDCFNTRRNDGKAHNRHDRTSPARIATPAWVERIARLPHFPRTPGWGLKSAATPQPKRLWNWRR
jgi:hypothetical protein